MSEARRNSRSRRFMGLAVYDRLICVNRVWSGHPRSHALSDLHRAGRYFLQCDQPSSHTLSDLHRPGWNLQCGQPPSFTYAVRFASPWTVFAGFVLACNEPIGVKIRLASVCPRVSDRKPTITDIQRARKHEPNHSHHPARDGILLWTAGARSLVVHRIKSESAADDQIGS